MTKSDYFKSPKFGMVFGPEMVSPIGRFVWPSLIEPKEGYKPTDGSAPGQAKYEVSLLIPKKSVKIAAFLQELKTHAKEMQTLFNQDRKAKLGDYELLKDGDSFNPETYPYYNDTWVLRGRNVEQPAIYDKAGGPLDAKDIIGGTKGRLLVSTNLGAYGLSFKVLGVQFFSDDGTRFGGATRDAKQALRACEWEEDDETEEEQASNVSAKAPSQKGKNAVNLLA